MLFQVTIMENGRHMAVEMDNLTTLVEDLHVEFNRTQAVTEQNDGERIDQEELKKNIDLMADKVISSIDRNSNNFMTKVRECQINSFKADSHIPCRSPAILRQCYALRAISFQQLSFTKLLP
jgi:hypothetical protein